MTRDEAIALCELHHNADRARTGIGGTFNRSAVPEYAIAAILEAYAAGRQSMHEEARTVCQAAILQHHGGYGVTGARDCYENINAIKP